ncbi:MAG: quinoprotein dehydrogenase-associated SoxYZ-like carrier [Burkholderiales bacterium]
MTRVLIFAAALLHAHYACAAEGDDSEIWLKIKSVFFAGRVIQQDLNGEVLTLRAPHRAQDASTVPIAISTHLPQLAQRYVEKLYLIIDKNPSPVAAIFTFTPESGSADIETRVRVEEYSHMRAVAQLSDGSTYMAVRHVKAAGGCSSPTGTAPDFENFKARVRIRTEDKVTLGESSTVQLMIQHPNTSGLAKDQLTQLFIPAYYVRTVSVTYAGLPILSADVDFSISENPNFRFHFVPKTAGELKAVITDTKEREWEGKLEIVPEPRP